VPLNREFQTIWINPDQDADLRVVAEFIRVLKWTFVRACAGSVDLDVYAYTGILFSIPWWMPSFFEEVFDAEAATAGHAAEGC